MSLRSRSEAGEEAAAVLERVWTPRVGYLHIPVDPVWIANAIGIRVVEARMEPDLAGLLYKPKGRDAEIYLNASDSRQRRRFTCAHELGHYTRRAGRQGAEEWGYLDRRDSLSARGTDPEEVWANQFAAALLMPEGVVRDRHRHTTEPVVLAFDFGVSSEAMGYRLRALGLAS